MGIRIFFYTPGDCYYFFGTQGSFTLPQLQRVYYPDPRCEGWQWPLTVERLGVQPVHPLREEMRHFRAVVRGEIEPPYDRRGRTANIGGGIGYYVCRGESKLVEFTRPLTIRLDAYP